MTQQDTESLGVLFPTFLFFVSSLMNPKFPSKVVTGRFLFSQRNFLP